MKALERVVERPLPVLLLASLIGLIGFWCLMRLPVKRNPHVEIPYTLVVVPYESAAPEDVESEVTVAFEEELNTLDRLRHLRSISAEGASIHVLEFEDRTDMADSLRAVQQKAELAQVEVPEGAKDAIVRELSFDDQPIVFFTLSGSPDPYLLRALAKELEPELESVPGVSRVEVFGGYEREVQIRADPPLLSAYDLTLEDLESAIRRHGRAGPAGRLRSSASDLLIRSTGEFETLEQIRSTAVGVHRGQVVLVSDVAEVLLHHAKLETGATYNGRPSVTLIVRRRPSVNTLRTTELLEERVEAYRSQLPDEVSIDSSSSSADDIRIMIRQLGVNAIFGIFLILSVLLVVFGLRQALIVACVLPFSLLFTFIGLHLFGMEISNVALFALILVLGLVVDGAIIVGEAIYQEREEGAGAIEASKRGISRVGMPVLSADLTTIAAFVPMLLMVGVMGQFMSVIPKVVVFALAGSIFADHIFLPAAAARVKFRPRARRLPLAPDGLPWFSPELPRTRHLYLRLLDAALHRRSQILAGSAIAFGLSVALLWTGVIGSIFLPEVDRGRFTLNYALPVGTSLTETNRVGHLIEREIEELSEVRAYVLTTGDTGALNSDAREGGQSGPGFGRITVELVPPDSRLRSQADVVKELRGRVSKLAGVDIDIEALSEGPPVGAALAVHIRGGRLEQLDRSSRAVRERVAGIPGVRDVRTDYERSKPEIRVELAREEAATGYGIFPEQVSRALRSAFYGVEVGRMRWDGERIGIRMQAADSFDHTIGNIRELGLRGSTGGIVTIGDIARVDLSFSHNAIFRHDTQRTITVRADAAEGTSSVALETLAKQELAELQLPHGVSLSFGGESEERDRSYASLWSALKWGILLIYFILALQFNSLLQPVIVLLAVPLSLVGVVIGLLVTGTPFSFMVFIGIVSLTGIVVNDGIVLIDGINRVRASGVPIASAIRDASVRRLRPVLLTTITTIFGLLPLTLNVTRGGEFWAPLGIAIISGLIVASGLTLLFVPILYSLITSAPPGWQPQLEPAGEPSGDPPRRPSARLGRVAR